MPGAALAGVGLPNPAGTPRLARTMKIAKKPNVIVILLFMTHSSQYLPRLF
jgi:hypothetical protein